MDEGNLPDKNISEERSKEEKSRGPNYLKTFSFLLFILALLTAFLYLAVTPFDLSHKKDNIVAEAESRINGSIDMSALNLKVLPTPHINLYDFRLTSSEGEVIMTSDRLTLRVSLLPLLFKHVKIKHLLVSNANIYITRSKEKKQGLNLSKIIKQQVYDVSIVRCTIRGGTLHFTDMGGEGEAKRFTLSDISLKLFHSGDELNYNFFGNLEPSTEVELTGLGEMKGGMWDLKGDISLRDLSLDTIRPYATNILDKVDGTGLLSFSGTYSTHKDGRITGTLSHRNLKIKLPKYYTDKYIDELTSPGGKASIDLYVSNLQAKKDDKRERKKDFKLSAEKINFDLGDFTLMGNVAVKNDNVSLNLATTRGSFNSLRDHVPFNKVPQRVIRGIERVKDLGGEVALKRLSLSTTKREGRWRLDTFHLGTTLHDFSLIYGTHKDEIRDLDGGVVYDNGDLIIQLKGGSIGESLIKRFSGTIHNVRRDPIYNFFIEADIDSAGVIDKLREARDRYKRPNLFTAFHNMEATGRADLNLALSGRWKDPSSITYEGRLFLKGVDYWNYSSPLKPKDAKGLVTFNKEELILDSIDGSVNGGSVNLSGNQVKNEEGMKVLTLTIDGDLTKGTIGKFVSGELLDAFSTPKPMNFKGIVKISGGETKVDSSIDLTEGSVYYKGIIGKKRGYKATITTSAKVKEGTLTIDKGLLEAGGEGLKLNGTFASDGSAFGLNLLSESLSAPTLGGLVSFVSMDGGIGGEASIDLNLTKSRTSTGDRKISVKGRVDISKLNFRSELLPGVVDELTLTSSFNGKTGKIKVDTFKTAGTDLQGFIDYKDVSTGEVDFRLTSENFNLSDVYIKKVGPEVKRKTVKGRTERYFRGGGTVDISGGTFGTHNFEKLTTPVTIDNDSVRFFPLSIYIDGGHASGNINYIRDTESASLATTHLDITNLDLDSFFQALGAEEQVLSGKATGKATATIKRGASSLMKGLNGKISLTSRGGRLWKFVAMGKIFSIINIISIDELFIKGLHYRTMSGDFSIKDGTLSSDNLLLESDSIRMSAVGTVDMAAGTTDTTFGIHPFVTVDKIISSIPLAGYILTGKTKSTVSLYYEVDGSLKNPKVRAIPVEALGGGILGIFERIFETPAKVLTPPAKNKAPN